MVLSSVSCIDKHVLEKEAGESPKVSKEKLLGQTIGKPVLELHL
jgi:hypothetical protein